MKRFFAIILSLFLILCIMCGCSTEKSSDSLDRILEEKKLKIGVNINNLPLSYKSGSSFEGFDIDIATEVCKRLDISAEFIAVEPKNAIDALNKRTIDCYWCYDAPARTVMSKALFAESLYKRTQSVLVKNTSGITEIIGLKGKIVGIQVDSRAESAIADATVLSASFAECRKYDSFENLSAALASDTINAAIVDNIYAKYAFISKYPSTYVLLDTAIATSDCRMVFRKKDSSLKNTIYAILDSMQEDSTVLNLSKKWFGEDITQGIRFNIKTTSAE